jgi:dephospho-CoA kinase
MEETAEIRGIDLHRCRSWGRAEMIVIGLVGQSGTGKTTVAAMLVERGAACLDMDIVAREIVAPGSPVLLDIERAFGGEFLMADGTLNRRKLGRTVFSAPAALELLNSITHPELVRKARAWIRGLEQSPCPPPIAVIDAAALFESGLAEHVDVVVIAVANAELQAERIAVRDGIPYEDAVARIRAQRPVVEMIERADFVIRTDCPLDETGRQVDELWEALVGGRPCVGDPRNV